MLDHIALDHDGLYPVLSLTLVLLTFAATQYAGGSGFLAVYVAGLVMGERAYLHKRSLTRFHDGLAWLAQIAMFITLGLLVFPSRMLPVLGVGGADDRVPDAGGAAARRVRRAARARGSRCASRR